VKDRDEKISDLQGRVSELSKYVEHLEEEGGECRQCATKDSTIKDMNE